MTLPLAQQLIKNYLDAMLDKRVDEAAKYIKSDAVIVYPGGKTFNAISTLAESSSKKFKTLHKNFHRFEGLTQDDGVHVIFVSGTLDGTWPDNTPFQGIRFIDRYEVDTTGIRRQEVWSDSAEFRLAKVMA